MMIQRRQNLYLLVIAVIAFILSFTQVSIASMEFVGEESSALTHVNMTYSANLAVDNDITVSAINSSKVRILLWMIVLISAISILSFKNLKRQIRLSSLNLAIILFIPVFVYLDYSELAKTYQLSNFNLEVSGFTPLALLILCILAIKGVLSDYNLLKSMDRIR